jgi:GNAT superfamily N-acetyltransferase
VAFAVRRAVRTDADELVLLERLARDAITDVRGGAALLAEQPAIGDRSAWEAAIDDPSRAVWVALVDEVPVGMLELVLPERAGGAGRVRQVFVRAEARELGFGDELLAEAIEATRQAGGAVIESFALPGDRDTKNLYERAGVTARKLIVSKRLDA